MTKSEEISVFKKRRLWAAQKLIGKDKRVVINKNHYDCLSEERNNLIKDNWESRNEEMKNLWSYHEREGIDENIKNNKIIKPKVIYKE